MASSDKKRKTKQKWKAGKGWHRAAKARREIVRVKMKIKRFEKNLAAGKKVSENNKNRSRFNSWDTTGLKNRLVKLQEVVKMGRVNY